MTTRQDYIDALKKRYAEQPFRVILEGTHSSGKSTLGAKLAELLDVPHHKEAARPILARRGHNADYAGCDTWEIMHCQEEIMRAHEDQVEGFGVIDRCAISVVAYSMATLATDNLSQGWHQGCVRDLYFLPKRSTCYMLVHPNPPLVADGVREPQWAKRQLIHYIITGLLVDQKISFSDIDTDDFEERIDTALRAIWVYTAPEWEENA